MKKGILIDVNNRTVSEVKVGDYTTIYEFVKCETFDVVSIGKSEDVYIDDNGLLNLNDNSMFFMINRYPQPLAGNGLILGINLKTGDSVDTKLTVDEVRDMVTFLTLDEVRKMV